MFRAGRGKCKRAGGPGLLPKLSEGKAKPPTAFSLNSGLFSISFRSEIYSPDPLERLVYLFLRQLCHGEDGVCKTLCLLAKCLLF